MAFKVLVSDSLADEAVQAMRVAGLDVVVKTGLSPEALLSEVADVDAIVVRSATKVKKETIDAAKKLKLVVRAGVGLDNVDAAHAAAKGIAVRNTPGASTNAVAELALGHVLALARHLGRGTATTKAGKWEKKTLEGVEIAGKTLGIIGIGRIGQSLAKKAAALGMKVVAYDKLVKETPVPGIVTLVPLDRLLASSDFISLHIPFDAKEGATIGPKEIAMMKRGVRIVNCARGGVIDEAALTEALASGQAAGAALDVFATEPPDASCALFAQPNLCLTPHIGASTCEAQERIGGEVAEIVIGFAKAR
jgi:D-3-phosphoglycerate dehydrogenase